MFMETLKSIVINLVTVIIFISAVELITPNNNMKKYIKFILGLILITVILNPIIKFISNGEKNIADNIKSYEDVFSKQKNKTDLSTENTFGKNDTEDNRKKVFINNFNKNCDNLLKNKFKDMTFKSEIDCDINFTNVTLNVKKLKIGVAENKVNKVKKIVINNGEDENKKEENEEYTEIANYASNELDIPKDKIEVYQMKLDSD